MNSTAKSVKELADNIRAYNEAYRKGTPLVPDQFYDQEVEKLRRFDPDNDWFKHIEPAPVGVSRKVKLPIPMKSLYKVKTLEELQKWAYSLGLGENCMLIITPKFDGLSLLHNEMTGMTYSRGGADNEGQDCTPHYKTAGYKEVSDELLFTYGEFVFSRSKWNKYFAGQISPETGEKYKSARNTAAGLLNRDQPSELLRHVDFFRYGADTASLRNFKTYKDLYRYLCDTYLQQPLFCECKVSDLSQLLLHSLFVQWHEEYFIDGLVVYINDLSLWEAIGRQETTGNPNYAIAYKNPGFTEVFTTKVLDVNWGVSKVGAFKPVVKVDAVDTGDCEMENPTGYNARWIKENKIAPGAVIKITRSGGVIPKILDVITPASTVEIDKMWDDLTECPHCGSSVSWDKSGVELVCNNPNCPGRRLSEIVFFYGTVGAENLGEKTISKIFDAGFNTLYKMLNITFDELMNIDGFGEEMSNNVLANNRKVMQGITVTTLMQASNCFTGIGKTKAQAILAKLSPEERNAFVEGLTQMPEPSELHKSQQYLQASKTERSFLDGINPFFQFVAENHLTILPMEAPKQATSNKYAGMKVCFTGVRDKMLEETIVLGGGEIASGVSKKTTHLIVADHDSTSSKTTKAKELNIPVLTIEEFIAL